MLTISFGKQNNVRRFCPLHFEATKNSSKRAINFMSCSWESLSVKTVVECCKNSTSERWREVARARNRTTSLRFLSNTTIGTLLSSSFSYKEKLKEEMEETETKTTIFGEKKIPFYVYVIKVPIQRRYSLKPRLIITLCYLTHYTCIGYIRSNSKVFQNSFDVLQKCILEIFQTLWK